MKNEYDSIAGSAFYKDDNCCGYLTVILEGAPQAPYWVLELGPVVDDLYDYSIVSDDKALSLFVLTRDVERYYKLYDEQVLESLNDFGFTKSINSPVVMNQTDCII
jgi:lipocalin